MSCADCCRWCCPWLFSSEKTPKLRYSSLPQTDIDSTVQADKVFDFPQRKRSYIRHPQMFVEPKFAVSNQPTPVPQFTLQNFSDKESYDKKTDAKVVNTCRINLPTPKKKASTLPRTLQSERQFEQASSRFKKELSIDSNVGCSRMALPLLQESTLEEQEEEDVPVLQFSVLYDVQRSVFTVHLHHASNLPVKARRSDPYVILYLMPNKEEVFQSRVIPGSLNPEFNQSFEFQQQHPDEIQRQTLIFRVVCNNERFSRSHMIGGVALPLEDADLFGVVMRMQINEKQGFSEVRH